MKALLAVAPLLIMAPCERPPVEYQGNLTRVAHVIFADPQTVHAVCREAAGYQGDRTILACTQQETAVVLMPNPCRYEDRYAQLLCHEAVGHVNGWRH